MNELFYETLKKNTSLPFELIVIDNNSTDGSLEFFKERADILIANNANYSYLIVRTRALLLQNLNTWLFLTMIFLFQIRGIKKYYR